MDRWQVMGVGWGGDILEQWNCPTSTQIIAGEGGGGGCRYRLIKMAEQFLIQKLLFLLLMP